MLCALAIALFAGGCSLFSQESNASSEPSCIEEIPNADEVQTSYAYDSLTDEAVKHLYLQICDAAQAVTPVDIKAEGELSEKQMTLAIDAYKNDYPETFWLENNFSYIHEDGFTYVYLSYSMTNVELIEAKGRLNAVIDTFLENAPKDKSEYERVIYANNYIVDNCVYDSEAAEISEIVGNESDAYGVLVDKKAVCSGYSRAFQLLCERLGLECVNITGIGRELAHQWNCVKIDGEWYNVDVTWNDYKQTGLENGYLILSDEQFYPDHTASKLYSQVSDEEFLQNPENYNTFIPECGSEKYNYFRMSYPVLYDFGGENYDEISSALAVAIKNGDETYSFVIDDSLDFESAAYKLIEGGYALAYLNSAKNMLWDQYDVTSNSAYAKENINVVTIVLEYEQ